MVAAIFLWYSQFLRIWGHKTCILDVGKIPRRCAAPPQEGDVIRTIVLTTVGHSALRQAQGPRGLSLRGAELLGGDGMVMFFIIVLFALIGIFCLKTEIFVKKWKFFC